VKSTKHLTKRQIEVLDFARAFLERNDEFPPMRSIADHFGWKSPNAAQCHIDSLAIMGFVERNEIGNWRFKREPA
jgi:SOS-response transcriptional repressor LexA